MVSVVFKFGHFKTFSEATDAASSVVNSSSDLSNPSSDVPIFKDRTVEESLPWALRKMTSKKDPGPSTLKWVQELCRPYCLSVAFNVCSVQGVIRDAFVAFVSVGGHETSLVGPKQIHTA